VAASNGPQTVFQLQALPAPGTTEYTIDIDGQQLRYRNTPPVWTNMVHPGPQGTTGAKISAVTFDGRTVELFNEAGQFGLQRLIESAAKTRKGDRWFELRWNTGGVAVAIELKIVSDAGSNGNGNGGASLQGKGFAGLRLPDAIVGRALAAAPDAPATHTVAALAGSTP
jgi:type VI secretion system protein ImpL